MAKFILLTENEKHVTDRAFKRFPAGMKVEYLREIIECLRDRSPKDWRFTDSPSCKFLVWDKKFDFRILCVSYRESGGKLLADLKDFVTGISRHGNKFSKWVDEYLVALFDCNAEVTHEVKTVYTPSMVLKDLMNVDRNVRDNLPHLSALVNTASSRRKASIPNVVVMNDETLGSSIWVRQFGVWTAPDADHDRFYTVELSAAGPMHNRFQWFEIDNLGKITSINSGKTKGTVLGGSHLSKPEEPIPGKTLRRRSYWDLPTVLDRRLIDLRYKKDHEPARLTQTEWALMGLLEEIIESAKKKLITDFRHPR